MGDLFYGEHSVIHGSELRALFFVLLFFLFAALEWRFPNRSISYPKIKRWGLNLSIFVFGGVLAKAFMHLLQVYVLVFFSERFVNQNQGVFSWVQNPWLHFALCFVVLDLAIYIQHLAFHRVSFLWRFHKMHHADPELDVSSGNRFHPIEILISLIYKVLVVALIAPSSYCILAFEIVLNACSLFNHSNIKIPKAWDACLRFIVVTPDMHLVHHSVKPEDHHSNFAFNFSLWDFIFGTYREKPSQGYAQLELGLKEYLNPSYRRLWPVLFIPFTKWASKE